MAWQIKAAGLPTPEREVVFAKPRRWRFDMAWPRAMVALELDGATWTGGRHSRGVGYARDCEKLNAATLAGWRVLRVTGDMVRKGQALALVQQALEVFDVQRA